MNVTSDVDDVGDEEEEPNPAAMNEDVGTLAMEAAVAAVAAAAAGAAAVAREDRPSRDTSKGAADALRRQSRRVSVPSFLPTGWVLGSLSERNNFRF